MFGGLKKQQPVEKPKPKSPDQVAEEYGLLGIGSNALLTLTSGAGVRMKPPGSKGLGGA